MVIQLGNNLTVNSADIMGVFDLDITSQSRLTRDFLNRAEKRGEVINAAGDLPKSFAVCVRDGRQTVYLSQFNSATLFKRSMMINKEDAVNVRYHRKNNRGI